MKFANQTVRRVDQTPTKKGGVINPSLWLPSNLQLNVKSVNVKVSQGRRVPLDLFDVLHIKQLNRKSVKGSKIFF